MIEAAARYDILLSGAVYNFYLFTYLLNAKGGCMLLSSIHHIIAVYWLLLVQKADADLSFHLG